MTSVQRLISNLDNRVVDAGITADDVAPAAHAAFPEPLEREGLGDIEISGAYTGAEDATLEIEITSDTAGSDRRTTAPEFTGVGNGSLEGMTASGAAAQSYTVSLIDTGTDTEAAEFPIEGVKLVAATAGVVGNLLELQVDASALTYTATGATTVDSADAGSDTFASDAWSLGGFPLIAGRLDPATPRIAFGDDPTIYRPFRERRDGRWLYRLTPALQNPVPAGAAVKAVTGSRTVVLTDGTTTETYNSIITAWDLLSEIQASSALVVIDGTASNDRTPGGMASRELALITNAKITRVEPTGTRYVSELDSLEAETDAQSQTVTVECTAADSVGKERWAVVGTADGDLGTATTGAAFTSSVLNFTVPPKIPLGGESLRFEHIATRYADPDPENQAPICLDEMHTGANARSRTLTLTYTRRPGAGCECDTTEYSGSVDAQLLGLDSLSDSGTSQGGAGSFDRAPYDAEYDTIADQLYGRDEPGVPGFSATSYRTQLDEIGLDLLDGEPGGRTYFVQHKAITDKASVAYAEGHQFGENMRATRDGSYILVLRNGVYRLLNGSGSSYSEASQMPTAFASYTFKQIIDQRQPILCKSGTLIRLFVRFKDNAAPTDISLERTGIIEYDTVADSWSESVHSAARIWDGFTDGAGDYVYTVDDARTTLLVLNADDGTTYASLDLTTLPTWAGGETAYLPDQTMSVSRDGAYIALVSRVSSTYTLRIFNLSGTTLTEQEDRSIGSAFYGTSLSDDGSRAWATNVGVLERSGSTWSDYDTQLGIRDDGWRLSPDGLVLLRTEGSGPYAVREDDTTEFVQTDADSGLGRAEEFAWITDSGTLLRPNPTANDVTAGTSSGEIEVYSLSSGVYSAGTPIQPEDDGSAGLCAVLGGQAESAAPYSDGYIAEFSSTTDADDWRSRYAGRLAAVEVSGEWRLRITLNAEFADDLDRTMAGDLAPGDVLYVGTLNGGSYQFTDYGTEAAALDAADAMYGAAQALAAGESQTAADPVVDNTVEYQPFTAYRAELDALLQATYEAEVSDAIQSEFVAWFDVVEADKADVISGAQDGADPAIQDRYETERSAYEAERANYDPETFDDYLAELDSARSEFASLTKYPALQTVFDAWWDAIVADASDVESGAIDGGSPSVSDRYATERTDYETARTDATSVWADTGADYWWVFSQDANQRGYLPAFTNVVYYSASRGSGGLPASTQEFAFVIKVACTNKLQEGDQIILNLDTGDAAYVVGDRWEIVVVAGASGSFHGGVDGDNTLTWDVRGSSSGALGTYAVEDGNETAYDANGLTFTIYRGQIPFSAGDRFTFSVEGGAWRWRFDDDDWAEETGFPDVATTLANGLSARFVAGSAPSFVAGDQYRWAIEQPAAPSHAADSFEDCWTFSGASAAWTATWGTAVDVAVVLIARHSLPAGSTVTVAGSAAAVEQFSETLTVDGGDLVLVLNDTATIDALQISPSEEGGSIGWIFAGDPPGIGGDADVSMQPTWAMIRSGLNGAVARGRQDNAELRWDYLTAAEAEHLAAIFDHSKSAGDQPLAYVPSLASDQPKLRLVRFADDALALPDLYAWTDDDPVLRDVTVSLTGVLL